LFLFCRSSLFGGTSFGDFHQANTLHEKKTTVPDGFFFKPDAPSTNAVQDGILTNRPPESQNKPPVACTPA